jgi:hypothetical protein
MEDEQSIAAVADSSLTISALNRRDSREIILLDDKTALLGARIPFLRARGKTFRITDLWEIRRHFYSELQTLFDTITH